MNPEAESANNREQCYKTGRNRHLKLTMNPGQNPPTTKEEQCYKTGKVPLKQQSMNWQNPPTTETMITKQAETAIKTNNEPRGRIRNNEGRQCYKTGRKN
jgi:hypothetical protein